MSWIPALFGMPIGGLARFHNRHSGQFIHLKRDVLTAPTGGYQFTAGDTIRDGKRSASEQVGRQDYVRCETADGQPGGTMSWFQALFEMPIGGLVRFHNRRSGQFTHLIRDALAAPAGGFPATISERHQREQLWNIRLPDGIPGRLMWWFRAPSGTPNEGLAGAFQPLPRPVDGTN